MSSRITYRRRQHRSHNKTSKLHRSNRSRLLHQSFQHGGGDGGGNGDGGGDEGVFFEPQEALFCGKHAINNLVGSEMFSYDTSNPTTWKLDDGRFNIFYICNQYVLKTIRDFTGIVFPDEYNENIYSYISMGNTKAKKALNSFIKTESEGEYKSLSNLISSLGILDGRVLPCNRDGNFHANILIFALRRAGYVVSDPEFDVESSLQLIEDSKANPNLVGFIVQQSKNKHWIAVRHTGCDDYADDSSLSFRVIDSL